MGEAEVEIHQRQRNADARDDAAADDERRTSPTAFSRYAMNAKSAIEQNCEDGEAEPEAAAEIRVAAGQEDVGEGREEPEEVDRSEIAARRLQPQEPADAEQPAAAKKMLTRQRSEIV